MKKLSHEQVSQVLNEAPGVIRGLVEENQSLRSKVASMELRDRAEKLAEAMHSKNMEIDVSLDDLTDRLEKAAHAGKLEILEEAVQMSGPDMGTKIAQLASPEEHRVSGTATDLERYIVGGVG